MKDVVFIVIDSLMADHVFPVGQKESNMPFLSSLKDNCLVFEQLYSQGPFTEAGTKGLLTGTGTLDDRGYLFRYDQSKNFITSMFKDCGYETYSMIYPTCLYSGWIREKIDQIYYTSAMLFNVFWDQRFSHYARLANEGLFDSQDLRDCIRQLDIIFEAWLGYLDPHDEKCRELLTPYSHECDFNQEYMVVTSEYQKFKNDESGYVFDLFSRGPNHILCKTRGSVLSEIIRRDLVSRAFNSKPDFIKKLKQKQFWLNLKNNKLDSAAWKRMALRLKNRGFTKYTFGEGAYRIQALTRGNDVDRCIKQNDYVTTLSAKLQFDKIAEILLEPHEKPRFVTAHVEEPHYFTTYFTFDSFDENVIAEELDYAESFVDGLPKNYKGLISYDLAVRYVDLQLKQLFRSLQDGGALNNTIVVVTADHGSSYNYSPPREKVVNNCHTENYHIPLVLFDSDLQGSTIDGLMTGCDVVPTLFDYLGLSQPLGVTGRSGLSGLRNEFITSEYMGPGCPDMRRNKACIGVRGDSYLLYYEGMLSEVFDENGIVEIYDLVSDPQETNNLVFLRNEEINGMISFLKERLSEIKENNKDYLG